MLVRQWGAGTGAVASTWPQSGRSRPRIWTWQGSTPLCRGALLSCTTRLALSAHVQARMCVRVGRLWRKAGRWRPDEGPMSVHLLHAARTGIV